ncbi:hypothetical protein NPIL_381811 [Nephila pilipes]|uniref:Uncharacterized protein n=1 Tax=Nephila pilipes TaxID=299642 RepID=A0A8X6MYV7_NEPPI|nr:hypothetical protein NPIL_381811 [Nephila pilipes]
MARIQKKLNPRTLTTARPMRNTLNLTTSPTPRKGECLLSHPDQRSPKKTTLLFLLPAGITPALSPQWPARSRTGSQHAVTIQHWPAGSRKGNQQAVTTFTDRQKILRKENFLQSRFLCTGR